MGKVFKKGQKEGIIPVGLNGTEAEFAGKQYQINDNDNDKKRSQRYQLFKDSLLKLLYSNFIWYGLEEYEVKHIENMLIRDGRICAIKTDFNVANQMPDAVFFGRMSMPTESLYYDFYGNPMSMNCTGYNGKIIKAYTQDNFVLGFDTCAVDRWELQHRPIIFYVEQLANELDDAFSAWKVASETRKCGMVFQCRNSQQKKVLQQVLSAIGENNPYITITGELTNNIETLFAPQNTAVISEYHMNFMNVWGSVMDLLGLENNSQNKRERLVVSEAEMNRSLSRYLSADRLRARKRFAEEMNKKFGTNIRVENYLASVVTETPNGANVEGDVNKEDITQ